MQSDYDLRLLGRLRCYVEPRANAFTKTAPFGPLVMPIPLPLKPFRMTLAQGPCTALPEGSVDRLSSLQFSVFDTSITNMYKGSSVSLPSCFESTRLDIRPFPLLF